jgi:hypothetical protein
VCTAKSSICKKQQQQTQYSVRSISHTLTSK